MVSVLQQHLNEDPKIMLNISIYSIHLSAWGVHPPWLSWTHKKVCNYCRYLTGCCSWTFKSSPENPT